MSNRGGIDSAITEILESDHQQMFIAVELKFDTEILRLWSGAENTTIGGNTYIGAGTLLTIGAIEDTLELKTASVQLSLAGMDSTVITRALEEEYQNRVVKIQLGFTSSGTHNYDGLMTLFSGRMVSMEIADDPDGSIVKLNCENRLIDLKKPSNFRYTKESQQYFDEDDTCFNRVQALQDKEIVWGRASSNLTGGGGVGDTGSHDPRRDMR